MELIEKNIGCLKRQSGNTLHVEDEKVRVIFKVEVTITGR